MRCLLDNTSDCKKECFLYECEALKIYEQGRADQRKRQNLVAYERKRFEDILNRVDVDSDNGEVHKALDTIRGML